ncbi:aldehyde dehydrogenase family protein [Flavobacterium jejuense]|uniref:Aldehyde dehydrogenase n=1 Tax=Flavobacterium jejuense TaxID=1544455 RepID=A0ABX0IZU5_9FLAO|nr:aldehyde dehydrogenase family protein [Flavobacterium jejuense]NHN28063.1 aldehyde dehydrogenase family protein [Flavobacterium jejuense]
MEQTIRNQRVFFNNNNTKSLSFRVLALKKLKRLLQENEEILNNAIYKDFKKSSFDNYTNELSLLYKDIDEATKHLKKWASIKKVTTNLVNFPSKSYIIPEPLGVTLIIGAWNYPYQLSFAPAIAAIAAGNTILLKPSELPINTSNSIAKLINENFDPSFFKVIEGGIPETTTLLNQKFDKIFFTGSVPVGKIVYQAAAKNLTPVTLELGGKSPTIVTENCDLKTTVRRLMWSKYLNAGQTCIAPDYVYVHETIKENFLKECKKEIKASNYNFENGNYVQIIDEKNHTRLVNLIDKEKIYFGGKHNITNRYIEPTILKNVKDEDEIMKDEIFGPILPVLSYTNLSEIIIKIKERPKPLSCYIFTNDNKTRKKILNEISFGSGAINEAIMQISNSNLPFGGVGQSGIGSYHGESGFKTFSHYKSILEKPNWLELNLKYFPHSKIKLKIIKFLMKLEF